MFKQARQPVNLGRTFSCTFLRARIRSSLYKGQGHSRPRSFKGQVHSRPRSFKGQGHSRPRSFKVGWKFLESRVRSRSFIGPGGQVDKIQV